MAAGGGGNVSQSLATLFQARLKTNLEGVSNTLTLERYSGDKIAISGVTIQVPSGGMFRDIADNLISAAGLDAGSPPAASTLYYVYVSSSRASFSASSIRLSAQAPTLVNGVRYLGNSGNALNWRFVGWVRPNATPQFESSLISRYIVNYYNRRVLSLFNCPGYVDDNTQTQYTTSSASWIGMNGGTASKLNFIANGEDSVCYQAIATVTETGAAPQLGVGEGSSTTAAKSTLGFTTTTAVLCLSVSSSYSPSEGATFLDLLVANSGGPSSTFVIDFARTTGDAADPAGTYISAQVLG